MPKLSFILPIYGVEALLPRALMSIRAQTFPDWEAILVDDGSPDRCGALCDAIAAEDPRFHVIHQRNAGVSAARNAGMDAATGEYLHFLDPDDYLEPDFAGDILDLAGRTGADWILFGFFTELQRADGSTQQLSQTRPPVTGEYDFAAFQQVFPKLSTSHFIWNRLFRRAWLMRAGCRYPAYALGEDAMFNLQTYAAGFGRMAAVDTPYLHYTVREGSAVGRYHPERLQDNFYITRAEWALTQAWGQEDDPAYRAALAYCALRDLQLGIKNACLAPTPWTDKRRWLCRTLRDGRLRSAVRRVPLGRFSSRNDRIKLLLLKLHAYTALILLCDTYRRQRR